MDDLKQILTDHAARYSVMEPTDAVKLIYQNEFGGGHLIRDEAACLAYLRREYKGVTQSDTFPLTEEIGNGLVRVNLQALDIHGYTPEALAADFIRSAAIHKGSVAVFREKLELLRQLADEGIFSFSAEVLDAYLAAYRAADYPMVSHSDAYRKAYQPAYRIVLKRFLDIPGKV